MLWHYDSILTRKLSMGFDTLGLELFGLGLEAPEHLSPWPEAQKIFFF